MVITLFRSQILCNTTSSPHHSGNNSNNDYNNSNRIMKSCSASPFLRAFRLHRSGIRFLNAGYYVDSIHTIIEGLEILQVSLDADRKDVTVLSQRWGNPSFEKLPKRTFIIDRNAMEHCCFTNEEWMNADLQPCCSFCQGSLKSAMVYNLALAYHLQALELDDGVSRVSYLNQALKLYAAAESSLRQRGLASSIPFGLENNSRHIVRTKNVPQGTKQQPMNWDPLIIPIRDSAAMFN